jgi:hypothetical protein
MRDAMTATHTPTPWRNPPLSVTVRGPDNCKICDCHLVGATLNSTRGDEANAAHIVRCVNAHDRLVAALRDATAYVELFTGDGVREQPSADVRFPNGDFDAEKIAANARAVLAEIDSQPKE